MTSLALRIAVVALAGAVGAVARWTTSIGSQQLLGRAWPIGTLVVNVVGCFIFGAVYEATRHAAPGDDMRRLVWLTGFCGAFTTFSTFAFDVVELESTRGLAFAALNAAAHLGLGLLAVVGGMAAGRMF